MASRRWSPEEDARLRELRLAGLSWVDIGKTLGVDRRNVMKRWQRLTENDAERVARLEKRRKYTRSISLEILVPDGPVSHRLVVPDSVLAERNARLAAPKTLTGIYCNDPPLGFSALDRKLSGVAA